MMKKHLEINNATPFDIIVTISFDETNDQYEIHSGGAISYSYHTRENQWCNVSAKQVGKDIYSREITITGSYVTLIVMCTVDMTELSIMIK